MSSSNYVAFTTPINPPGVSPRLSVEQVWLGLQRKFLAGQDFFPDLVSDTQILSKSTTKHGLPLTVIEATFKGDHAKMKETCIEYAPMKVELLQANGNKVENVISRDATGALYLTFAFEWLHHELTSDEMRKDEQLAQLAVELTLEVMRKMARDGRLP
ncbi:MAG: hypothetical protein Q9227_005052 [Pyrenula ochraceoflavens]